MSIIKSLVIAFSMYSKIPMPHLELDEKDMKYVMGFFPLIGLITGALVYGWIYAGEILYVPDISRTLILIILPVIITGGIHVDGYMDTCDALNSYGDREKKLAILKDSHIGAFAVIKLLVYHVLYFAAAFIVVQKVFHVCVCAVLSQQLLLLPWHFLFYFITGIWHISSLAG